MPLVFVVLHPLVRLYLIPRNGVEVLLGLILLLELGSLQGKRYCDYIVNLKVRRVVQMFPCKLKTRNEYS